MARQIKDGSGPSDTSRRSPKPKKLLEQTHQTLASNDTYEILLLHITLGEPAVFPQEVEKTVGVKRRPPLDKMSERHPNGLEGKRAIGRVFVAIYRIDLI